MTSPAEIHDAVVQHVALTRFPFPDQTDWPETYLTIANAPERHRAVTIDGVEHWPDIVIIDSATGEVAELGEVEPDPRAQHVARWAGEAALCKQHPHSGMRHFFIYVPAGLEAETQRLLESGGVPYGGVRGWQVADDGSVSIVPFVTLVDPKDHR